MCSASLATHMIESFEEGKGAVVGVEHHLLGLARIGPHKQHAAVAQPDMRHLDGNRCAVDQHSSGGREWWICGGGPWASTSRRQRSATRSRRSKKACAGRLV